jgi:hypothetical protein
MISDKYRGRILASSPYDTIVDQNVVYTVEAIRTIGEMINSKQDPLQRVYLDVGRTEEDMLKDMSDFVRVVVLTNGSGNYGYIPETHVSPATEQGGNEYVEKTVGINLGIMSGSFNTELFTKELIAFVESTLGVTPKIKTFDSSSTILLNNTDTASLESERSSKRDASLYSRYKKCVDRNGLLEDKVKRLNNIASLTISEQLTKDIENSSYLPNLAMKESLLYSVSNSTMRPTNNIGVEYLTNKFAFVTENNLLVWFTFKYGELFIDKTIELDTDCTNYTIIGTREGNIGVVYNKEDGDDLSGDVYIDVYGIDYDLLTSTKLLSDVTLNNSVCDHSDNKFTVGLSDDKYAYCNIYTISDAGDIFEQSFTIDGIGITSSYLDANVSFPIGIHGNKGALLYKDKIAEITVSGYVDSLSSDDVFVDVNTENTLYMFKSSQDECFDTIAVNDEDVTYESINTKGEVLTSYNAIFDGKVSHIKTLDRSFLTISTYGEVSVKIKKLI